MALLAFVLYNILTISIQSVSVGMIPQAGTPPSYRELSGLTKFGGSIFIYGGLKDSTILEDMWQFDPQSNIWTEQIASSVLSPGPRSNPYLITLQDQNKILLFGGETKNGPVSDLWLYDITRQSVTLYTVETHRREWNSPYSSIFQM